MEGPFVFDPDPLLDNVFIRIYIEFKVNTM